MFKRKQEEEPKQVKCEECKHYVDKEDAQEVFYGYRNSIFFCPMHKKPYDEMLYGANYKYIKAQIRVDENGKPVDKNWHKKLLN